MTRPEESGIPVLLGGHRLVQADETCCGPAALVMLAATGDERLARWLAGEGTGEGLPEVPSWARGKDLPAADRFEVAQRHLQTRARDASRAWPPRFGTLPAAAARLARYADRTYEVTWLPSGTPRRATGLNRLVHAVGAGLPCLLYVGGAAGSGVSRRIPRHVVLAVPAKDPAEARAGQLNIFEPSAGALFRLPVARLDDDTVKAAYGNWARPYAVITPARA